MTTTTKLTATFTGGHGDSPYTIHYTQSYSFHARKAHRNRFRLHPLPFIPDPPPLVNSPQATSLRHDGRCNLFEWVPRSQWCRLPRVLNGSRLLGGKLDQRFQNAGFHPIIRQNQVSVTTVFLRCPDRESVILDNDTA